MNNDKMKGNLFMFMPFMLNGHKKFHRGERRGFSAAFVFSLSELSTEIGDKPVK